MAGVIERTQPRISINKLGEYLNATPARRRSIVADQRRPKGFLVPTYNDAQAAIVEYLTSAAGDASALIAEMQRLRSTPVATAWAAHRHTLASEALAAFLESLPVLRTDLTYQRGAYRAPALVYGDVSVSVRPELVLTTGPDSARRVGALKLYFSKTRPLTTVVGGYIAAAVAEFSARYLALDAKVDYKLCQVLDVFAGQLFVAPRVRTKLQREITAACDEIRRLWDVV